MRRSCFLASCSLVALLLLAACGRTKHSSEDGDDTVGTGGQSSHPSTGGGSDGSGGSTSSSGGSAGEPGSGGDGGHAEGGAGGEAATGGAGGEPALPQRSLAGSYDVFVNDPASLPGCGGTLDEHHLTLWVEEGSYGIASVWLAEDFQAAGFVQFELGDDTLSTTEQHNFYTDHIERPALQLDLDDDGFAGTGHMDFPIDCGVSSNVTVSVPITISPDITPPVGRLDSWLPLEVQVAHERMSYEFSEGLFLNGSRIPLSSYYNHFATAGIAKQLMKVVDLDDNPLEMDWSGSFPDFSFPASAAGKTYDVSFDPRLTDRGGNPLTTKNRIHVLDPGAPKALIDFEGEAPSGAWGNAYQVPAGAPNSPCESGACFVLEGVGKSPSIDAALAISLPYAEDAQFEFRYRVWVDKPSDQLESYPSVAANSSDCMFPGQAWLFEPVSGEEPYLTATGWTTQTYPACGHDGLMTPLFHVYAPEGVGYRVAFEYFSTFPTPPTQ